MSDVEGPSQVIEQDKMVPVSEVVAMVVVEEGKVNAVLDLENITRHTSLDGVMIVPSILQAEGVNSAAPIAILGALHVAIEDVKAKGAVEVEEGEVNVVLDADNITNTTPLDGVLIVDSALQAEGVISVAPHAVLSNLQVATEDVEEEGVVESASEGLEGVQVNDLLCELVPFLHDAFSSEPECECVEHLGRDKDCPSNSDKKDKRKQTRILRSSTRASSKPSHLDL